MALNDLELFNRNEHLVLLDSLKHQRISKEQELVLELEKITTSQDISIKKPMDFKQVNLAFKSLNCSISNMEQKIKEFNKLSTQDNRDTQFIHIGCSTSGLNLTQALQDVISLKANDVSKLIDVLQQNQK